MTKTPKKPVVGNPADVDTVPIGWALLRAEDDRTLSVLCELDDGPPRVTDGYGGWNEVDRRGRVSLTDWAGFKPISIELDLYLDDFDAGKSVEGAIDVLEALGGRGRLATGGQPPVLIVNTQGVMPFDAHVFPGARWVINDLEWDDDATIVNDYGNRVRAGVTVSLLQHVDDQRLQDRALAARRKLRKSEHNGARRRVVAKSGDTLMSIARRELGDAGRWTQLAKINGIRDPRSIRSGAVIRLP